MANNFDLKNYLKEGKLHENGKSKLQENKDNMPWYISDLLQTVKDGRLSPEDVDYLINQLKLASKKEGTPSDSNISKESIISKANSTDAEGFQQFLEDNDITHEWNEVTVGDFNNGIYDVYLDDFDMPVRYISGKYSPEEDNK
jgi:hypothetical protein